MAAFANYTIVYFTARGIVNLLYKSCFVEKRKQFMVKRNKYFIVNKKKKHNNCKCLQK